MDRECAGENTRSHSLRDGEKTITISLRRVVVAVLLLAPLAWGGVLTTAKVVGDAAADAMGFSLSGWVVDANSWLGQGVRGPQYQGRSVASAEAGTPLVLLTDDGTIVFPVQVPPAITYAINLKLKSYAQKRVRVGGRLVRRGPEKAIVIQYVTPVNDPAVDAPTPAEETSRVEVVARVVGLNSWMGQDGSGPGGPVAKLARFGEPLVLVDDSGYVLYPVTKSTPSGPASHYLLADHAEHKVRVKGTLIERGKARAILIDNVVAYADAPDVAQGNLQTRK